MWNKLAAKEVIEGRKCLLAAKSAPVNAPVASNGWALAGWNKAMFLGEAEACFSRARLFRNRVAA